MKGDFFKNLVVIRAKHKMPLVLLFKIIKINVVGGDSGEFGGNTLDVGKITEA